MNRILVAVGAATAVVIVGLGASTFTGDPSEPQPKASTPPAAATDVHYPAKRPVRDESTPQADDLARRLKAAQDQMAQAVRAEAERLAAEQS